jgi:hypothetical protein
MTLIIGIYVKCHALQVSDRLVSFRTIPPRTFDPLANKTIVYFARRGIVSLSAAGLAHLGGNSTDTWIAETLSGLDLSQRAATAFGRGICHPFDVGQALEHLRVEAGAALAREPGSRVKEIIDIQVIGSQWDRRRGRMRPVICKVTNQRTHGPFFEKLVLPRIWPPGREWAIIGSGIGFPTARQHLRDRFRNQGGLISPENCLTAMVDAVRSAADQHPGVIGKDCMCVHIKGATPMATVSFRPDSAYEIKTPASNRPEPIAFTPYVIARDMVAYPSLSANNMFMTVPGVDIRFEGAPPLPLSEQAAWLQSQQRPNPPPR